MAKSRPSCHYCSTKLRDGTFTRDHIVPKGLGGANAKYNLVPSCPRCNNAKGMSSAYRDHCLICTAAWEIHEGIIPIWKPLGQLQFA